MGPKRFDAIEALKAQAVAARTYALAHRGQFEAEGYDICPAPKCQAYGGVVGRGSALDGGRRRHAGARARLRGAVRRRALRLDVRRRHRERRERVLGRSRALPRLGRVRGARERGDRGSGRRAGRRRRAHARSSGGATCSGASRRGRRRRGRRASRRRRGWAGVPRKGAPPAKLTPAAVYPSLIAAFDLTEARALQLTRAGRGLLRRASGRGRAAFPGRPAARTSSCCGSASRAMPFLPPTAS